LVSSRSYKNSKENQSFLPHHVSEGGQGVAGLDRPGNRMEISTPIAIFTTAYARILMSEYKIKYQDNLYYSDTDSLVLDCKLSEDQVGTGLGLFKLEHEVDEGVFISPKVYALSNKDGSTVIKVKGLKDADKKISLDDLKALIFNNPNFSHTNKIENTK